MERQGYSLSILLIGRILQNLVIFIVYADRKDNEMCKETANAQKWEEETKTEGYYLQYSQLDMQLQLHNYCIFWVQ